MCLCMEGGGGIGQTDWGESDIEERWVQRSEIEREITMDREIERGREKGNGREGGRRKPETKKKGFEIRGGGKKNGIHTKLNFHSYA